MKQKTTSKRIEIEKELEYINDELEGNIENVIEFLTNKHKELIDKGYTNIKIKDDRIGDPYYSIYGSRLETDKECKKRLSKIEKAKLINKSNEQKVKKQELKQIERLLKKYPDYKPA